MKGSMPSEEGEHAALVRAQELAAWGKFDVFAPEKESVPSKAEADSCSVLTRKMADGRKNVKARLVA